VKLDNDHEILAYTAGKMRKFRTGVGDRVIVVSTICSGRISFRHQRRSPAVIQIHGPAASAIPAGGNLARLDSDPVFAAATTRQAWRAFRRISDQTGRDRERRYQQQRATVRFAHDAIECGAWDR
jgi:hypothetical protein